MIKFLRKHKTYLLIGYVFLLLVHFAIKDNFYLTGILFYAFPLPILIVATLPLLALFYTKKGIRFILIGVIGCLLIFWIKNQYINGSNSKIDATHSILFWNIANQKDYNISTLEKIIDSNDIDALFFVEALHKNNKFNAEFEKRLSGYNIQLLEGNMMVAARKHITTVGYLNEKHNYRLNHLKVALGKNTFDVALVDVFARPLHNKEQALSDIITYSEKNGIDIIVGDFNTPYESIYFDKFKSKYTSARNFQNGFTATWPNPVPLLEIDQVWISKRLVIHRLEKNYNHGSDHALLITEFE